MHASGQWLALGTLIGGGTLVLYPGRRMDMAAVLQLVARERVTMLILVGDTSARPLLDELRAHPDRYDTSSLRVLGSGAAILSADVKEQLLDALPSVLGISEGLGSSESPVQAAATTRRDGRRPESLRFDSRPTTVVFDDDWKPVAPGSGQVGRMATTGRVPLGYYNDPERSARTFVEVDGQRYSVPGDMATVDADGSIRLVGRGSLCINTGGEKVYPEEVEAALKSHAAITDALVVGVPDERWGQRVAAVVSVAPGATEPSLDELQAHCRHALAGYKLPRTLTIVDTVRRSPSGKGDYPWATEVVQASP
jgi:acyl-CoA synthetase (AMP-forming)/AMP-acid ligase II